MTTNKTGGAGPCAVLFDYGKVLSLPADAEAWAQIGKLTGLNEATLGRLYWAHRDAYDKGTLNGVTYWQTIAREGGFSLDETRLAALHAADVELWGQMNEPMVAWALSLQRRGIKTGILSNIGDAMEAGLWKRFDWIGGFTHHTWSHRHNLTKPDAAIYKHAVEGLGCPAAGVLFIDDREENVRGAIAAGLQAILYTTHEEFEKTMRERRFVDLLDT
ncbi:MAG TPA: HAD family phosphatase [Acidobacteriaceae bacterium]|nr:HAD family phosphatase [Acidobacteriaceae bacterium]